MSGVDVRTCELFEQDYLLLLQRLPWFYNPTYVTTQALASSGQDTGASSIGKCCLDSHGMGPHPEPQDKGGLR